MNQSEKTKTMLDTFGRLSFMLETYVKLQQTGDHSGLKLLVLESVIDDAEALVRNLDSLKLPDHE